MKEIKNQEFGGERPLYCERDLLMEDTIVDAPKMFREMERLSRGLASF